MKFHVKKSCIGCTLCASVCPEIFSIGEDGFARATMKNVDSYDEKSAREAKNSCPTGAIEEIE